MAEIEISTPNKITGRILRVDKIQDSKIMLSIVLEDGIKMISFNDIQSLKFTDPQRNEDVQKALSLVLEASVKKI